MRKASLGGAFTLLELLVVLAIIVALAVLLLAGLEATRDSARGAACISNLRQISVGLAIYTGENGGQLPFGPVAGPYGSPSNLYPSTGSPTSLLSLSSGQAVGLGMMLPYLKDPRVLFCPGSDQAVDAQKELAKVGHEQAQGSYYYRHAGNTELFDNPRQPFSPEHTYLTNLGLNRNGKPIRALVVDSQFNCPKGLQAFSVSSRTHHRQKFANVLYADGHVSALVNSDGRAAVTVTMANIRSSFGKIMEVLELADEQG